MSGRSSDDRPDVPPVPVVPQAPGAAPARSPYAHPVTPAPAHTDPGATSYGPTTASPISPAPPSAPAPGYGFTDPKRSPYAPPETGPRPPDLSTPHGVGPAEVMPEIAKPPLDPVSVTAVVSGAVGLGPVAVVLGALGLRRTSTRWLRSTTIAGVGLGLGVLGTIGWGVLAVVAALGGFGGASADPVPGDVDAPRTVQASALARGNCVEHLPPQQEVGELALVPCAQPHLAQVVDVTTLDVDTYPGPDAAVEQGEAACATAFGAFDTDDAAFLEWWLVPSPAAWDDGVRTVACLVRSTQGQVETDLVN
ncbi:hypothetical protein FH969_01730 [Miniimonas arenae]|uniref:Septum formation-related domain-containing protein n=1 Tax=Miniimonas arenae TaxID=676201 RepID=A0A5C5BE82_9MICO|nr:septum formation family protein [Miniimonas arenae]TNU76841.1 hypothetical protein FH969_01730 [Miniimonas arenae]